MADRMQIQDIYPLTPMQEGMLFHSLAEQKSSTYFEQISYRLRGELAPDIVKKSLDELFRRYDILRTAFIHEGVDRPVQVVLKDRPAECHYRDLRPLISSHPQDKEAIIRDYKEKDRQRSFDLGRDVLMRVAVLQLDEQEYEFIWSHHHILMDGWCSAILIAEYAELYDSILQHRPARLNPVIPYRVYIQWLEKQDKEESKQYWVKYLESFEQATSLPRKNTLKGSALGYRNERFAFSIDPEKTARCNLLAAQHHVTPNTLIQTLWAVLLAKYNGRPDIVFGAVVSGRPNQIPGVESMVGLFINTIPVRVCFSGQTQFKEILTKVQGQALESEPHHYYPLADIQAHSPLKQGLLDHILVFENFPLAERIDGLAVQQKAQTHRARLAVSQVDVFEQTNYDFLVVMGPGTRINIRFGYNGHIYDSRLVERVAGHLLHLVDQVLENDALTLDELTLLTEEERQQVLCGFNNLWAEYPAGETLHRWFEREVEQSPDRVALLAPGPMFPAKSDYRQLTYREVNRRSNHLARVLRAQGCGPDQVVGLLAERSNEVVIGMLAILKAGGAYLPIDPEYPQERVRYMLEDSRVKSLLTNCRREDIDPIVSGQIQVIDIGVQSGQAGDEENLVHVDSETDLAYVIYTSGSTGKPKGVMLEQRNLVNLIIFHHHYTNLDCTRVLQFSTISFDVSFHEIFSTLLAGGRLHVADKELRGNIRELFRFVAENHVKTVFLPISLLKIIFSDEEYIALFPACVRHIQTAGEQVVISGRFARYLRENGIYLHNHYGPAETHVVTAYTADPQENIPELPPIGKPILNTAIYIFDRQMNVQPIGVAGELYIGGLQVGRGYQNNPELTAERFVGADIPIAAAPRSETATHPSPLTNHLYKTGDLARFLPDGAIDFLGRIDQQVKIRGFRIEPGEIESRLLLHPAIKETVVIPFDRSLDHRGGEKFLCAYLVCRPGAPVPEVGELREFLGRQLPDYMVPAFYVFLDEIPLTPNGKINRRALPEPDLQAAGLRYVAPRDGLEEKLAAIWSRVLSVPRESIGIDAGFFDLGGHSLKAIILVSQIRKECAVEFPLGEVFRSPTIRKAAEFIKGSQPSIYEEIQPVEKQDYYPQSSAQKRLFFLDQFAKVSISYNLPSSFRIMGRCDRTRYQEAGELLVQRHEALRTSFHLLDNTPIQRVHDRVDFQVEEGRLAPGVTREDGVRKAIRSFIRPFDLASPPLLRIGLLSLSPDEFILLVDMHHIVSDGTSLGLLIADFLALYTGRPLPPLHIQYKDFSGWQNRLIQTGRLKDQENYWLNRLAGEIPRLDLPLDFVRPALFTFAGNSIVFKLGADESRIFGKLAADHGATLYMNILAALNVLLFRYTGQDDIILGGGVVGRPHADIQEIIGMFVNTLVLRNRPAALLTYLEFLHQVKESSIKAFENQDIQFEDLVEKLNPQRDPSRNPIFDVGFVLQNHEPSKGSMAGVSMVPYTLEDKTAKFDIMLTALQGADSIHFHLEYCTSLFKPETIERLAGHLVNLIGEIGRSPQMRLGDIEFLSATEKEQLLYTFAQAEAFDLGEKNLVELFSEQVVKSPDRIAIVGANNYLPLHCSVSYKELDGKAAALAGELVEKGVLPNTIVGLKIERSIEMIIGILGILKAGGAYLPIDPESPAERVDYMLADSGAEIVIGSQGVGANCRSPIQDIGAECKGERQFAPTDLAYVMYTSGSTGNPKGTLISHRNVIRVVKNTNYIDITEHDRLLQLSNYAFDGSVFDIYGALLNGAALVLIRKDEILSLEKLSGLIRRQQITVFFVTTALFNTLVDLDLKALAGVRKILFGGEQVSVEHVKKALAVLGKERVIHVYGPTETTVYASYFPIQGVEPGATTIPIGRPLTNTGIYILDGRLKPMPLGAKGEIYIAGQGLSRGYLNNPELTAERFVGGLYKTGDLARWLPEGEIEFLGRIDFQVKIRGFRIEPGEIEVQLLKHPDIKEAAVLVRHSETSGKYLCAYLVMKSGLSLSSQDLREFLSRSLPDYMVPYHFVQLDRFPLNANGKLDRRALPEPGLLDTQGQYLAPRDELEKTLVRIWAEVLAGGKKPGKPPVIGIEDDFFQLGGHSLKATALLAQIHREIQVRIPITEIFRTPTVKGLAEFVRGQGQGEFSPIEAAEDRQYYPLSSAQKRIYILQQLDISSTAYNIPQDISLPEVPDEVRFKEIFGQLIERHESLRTSFKLIAGEPVQHIHQTHELGLAIEYFDSEIGQGFIRPFDLSQVPLFRLALIRHANGGCTLLLDIHHIVADGLSVGILGREFISLAAGQPLPDMRIQYKDYAVWQKREKEKPGLREQESFWLREFSGEIPVLNLPTDYPRPEYKTFEGDEVFDEFDPQAATALFQLASTEGVTLYMVMLALSYILLARLSGQEDIVIGTPTAGRGHADLQNIIGMFVNTLALRQYPTGEKTFAALLDEVKSRTLRAFDNQDYQFEDLVERLAVVRDTSRSALFSVMFALQEVEGGIKPADFGGFAYIDRVAKFDLTLTVVKMGERLFITFQYCTRLFRKESVQRFIRYYQRLTAAILENPDRQIGAIDVMSEAERQRLLVDFNATQTDYPRQMTLTQLFTGQVDRTPDSVAASFEDRQMSFRELGEMAFIQARVLIGRGVAPGALVGIMMERSLEMIMAIMAILCAGGAYLPIDPDYPEERINYILADSGAEIVIGYTSNLTPLSSQDNRRRQRWERDPKERSSASTPSPGVERGDWWSGAGASRCERGAAAIPGKQMNAPLSCVPIVASAYNLQRQGADPAYVIYTSGSSGRPKGVAIAHQGAVNYICWAIKTYVRGERVDFPLFTSIAFDLTVTSIFTPLLSGNAVVVYRETAEEYLIQRVVEENRVDVVKLTPSHLKLVLAFMTGKEDPGNNRVVSRIKRFILGGEDLETGLAKEATEKFSPGLEIYNEYGPTEATVGCMIYRFCPKTDDRFSVPIGKPADNAQIYILDRRGEPVPEGVVGELVISGPGLARGYLNNPELTAERFAGADVPIGAGVRGDRFYRTGDLARFLPDNNLEFLGRADQQVKINGYRIEVGEIENRLRRHPGIKDVVVAVSGMGSTGGRDKFLCAYLVTPENFTIPDLRKFLAVDLPAYMIPAQFIRVDKIPLTTNGKVDYRALAVSGARLETGVEYVSPQTDVEKKVAEIWLEVLELEKVGIYDNFFEIGGNSLKIIRLHSRLKEVFDRDIPVVALFRYTSVSAFSGYLGQEEMKTGLIDDERTQAIERGKKDRMQRLQKRKGVKDE